MTQREVRGSEEGAGHLRSTPLPVSATKLRSAEILANPDGVIRTRERDLVDNITMAMADTETPRNPDTGRREQEGGGI